MTQAQALDILKNSNDNVFLTGQPGAGKSYLTNQFIDWLLDNGHDFAVTASTGIAALNINGKTLHSFMGVRDDDPLTDEDVQDVLENSNTVGRYIHTKVLIIDEISMVSAQLLDNLDQLARIAHRNTNPFGGLRVIAVGDFYQLPPVKGEYCFKSAAWQAGGFRFCNITEQHRTNDTTFIDVLAGIRSGILTDEQKAIIRTRVTEDVSALDGVVRLDTHNAKVDDINDAKLKRLTTPPRTYRMTEDGDEKYIAGIKKSCLSPEILILKIGARVLFTRNDFEQRWVNGTQGEVVALNDESVDVRIFANDTVVTVPTASWDYAKGYGKNKVVLASIKQLPLRLAWAITIHKSQGMTLDCAVIDVSRVFATGQAYVAISRVRALDGVYFQGKLTAGFLAVDESVKEFYARHT
jgi:ATP-dependent exoDNAse (exonuclease V) alpha subunit